MGKITDEIVARAIEYISDQSVIYGISLTEMCKQMDISPGAITSWQAGKKTPTLLTMEKLIAWGMTPEELFLGKPTKAREKPKNFTGQCFALENGKCGILTNPTCTGPEHCHFFKPQSQFDWERTFLTNRR